MTQVGHYIEDLTIGMSDEIETLVTAEIIEKFAEISGDNNPLHLDEDYAKTTMFKQRIAHGMLSAGFISAVLGTKLPGYGAVYMSQTMKFKAPVKIGDTVLSKVTVKEINAERRRATFSCVCSVGETVVVEGEAMMMVPSKAKA